MTKIHNDLRRKAGLATVGAVAALALTACGAQDGFRDLTWENGDPLLSPHKATLFDESGEALCDTPTVYNDLETRSRAFSTSGGIVINWLFEVMNEEPDPETAENEKTRKAYERMQGSLERIYEFAHPLFDEANGITDQEGYAAKKEEWQAHLATLGDDAPLDQYVRLVDQWLDTPDGRYSLRRVSDVEGYIEDNNIPTRFRGLQNTYLVATNQESRVEYLLITNKETGDAELLNADESVPVGEEAEAYAQYEIDLDNITVPNLPEAQLTLRNDQCPSIDGKNVARYWVYEFEMLDATEPEAVDLI